MPPPHQAAPWELLKEIPKLPGTNMYLLNSNLPISLGGTQRNGTLLGHTISYQGYGNQDSETQQRLPLRESRTFLFAYSLPDAFSRVASTQPSEEYARASLALCLMAVSG